MSRATTCLFRGSRASRFGAVISSYKKLFLSTFPSKNLERNGLRSETGRYANHILHMVKGAWPQRD